jgi:hypothetical protein
MTFKYNYLSRARFDEHTLKEPMLVLDFDDNWHVALKLKEGMTKHEVAREFERVSRLI